MGGLKQLTPGGQQLETRPFSQRDPVAEDDQLPYPVGATVASCSHMTALVVWAYRKAIGAEWYRLLQLRETAALPSTQCCAKTRADITHIMRVPEGTEECWRRAPKSLVYDCGRSQALPGGGVSSVRS